MTTVHAHPFTQTVSAESSPALLEVEGLQIEFAGQSGRTTVVDDVSFRVQQHETVGLVGESGSGKTVTMLSILGLIGRSGRVARGSVRFKGRELLGLPTSELRNIRGDQIAMVFQEPMASLNPAFTVGDQIAESVRQHRQSSKKASWTRAVEMLDLVGIPSPARRARDYPHNLSGGMRQRVMIAIALACDPELLIADEPTTALDATIQSNILQLLRDLQVEFGMAMVLVTHDLGIVADSCQRVLVMYAGEIIEAGPVEKCFDRPLHPYTEGLLRCMPQVGDGARLCSIEGTVPSPSALPSGCRFHPRCNYVEQGTCTSRRLGLAGDADHLTRCVRSGELSLRGTT